MRWFSNLLVRYLIFEILFQRIFYCFRNSLLELLDRLRHAKSYHRPERQLQSVLLLQKINPTKHKWKSKRKLFLTSRVKRRKETLTHHHLLYVVHKHIQLVQQTNYLSSLRINLFKLVDPRVQVRRRNSRISMNNPLWFQIFMELYIEKLQKIGSFIG